MKRQLITRSWEESKDEGFLEVSCSEYGDFLIEYRNSEGDSQSIHLDSKMAVELSECIKILKYKKVF